MWFVLKGCGDPASFERSSGTGDCQNSLQDACPDSITSSDPTGYCGDTQECVAESTSRKFQRNIKFSLTIRKNMYFYLICLIIISGVWLCVIFEWDGAIERVR